MNKEEQLKSIKEKVEPIRRKHERNDRTIRRMKEGKLETLGTIVASDDGDVFIHIAGDKLIFMETGFLHKFKEAIAYLDIPEGDLIVARLMEFEAKQIRESAEIRISQIKEINNLKSPQRKE